MPFNLKALGLQPGTLYNVSVAYSQDGKEYNTIRSFTTETPKIFNKRLSTFGLDALVKIDDKLTSNPSVIIPGSSKNVSISYISWKVKGSFIDQANPPYATVTIKFKKKASFSGATMYSYVAPGGSSTRSAMAKAIYSYIMGKSFSTNKNHSIIIPKLLLTDKIFGTWSDGGVEKTMLYWNGSKYVRKDTSTIPWIAKATKPYYWKSWVGSDGKTKYAKITAAVLGQEILTPDTYAISKTLTASVETSLYRELVDNDKVKDVVYWLYSEAPTSPQGVLDDTWLFLDFNFTAGSRRDGVGWNAATGQKLWLGGESFYLPSYSNAPNLNLNNGILQKKIIFDNSVDGTIGESTTDPSLESPQQTNVAYVIVRYINNNGNFSNPQWIAVDEKGRPQISQITTAVVTQ